MSGIDSTFFSYIHAYMPSIILVIGSVVVLLSNAFASAFSRSTSLSLCVVFMLASLLFCLSVSHRSYVIDIVFASECIILISAIMLMLLIYSRHRFVEFQTPEFYPLYLLSVSGFVFMVNSGNLLTIFLGLEVGSLPLCAMMAFSRRINGIEASIKYFISSALASMFFLLGILFFYIYSGSFDMSSAISLYASGNDKDIFRIIILFFGAIFMLGGIGFKISLVPWHSWMPDIYEGSNPVLAGYISIVPKIAGFAVFAGIFGDLFKDNVRGYVEDLIRALIFISITVPNIAALLQKDLKRMLAFSSISHSGFALACIYLGSVNTLIFYWVLFMITNIGAFGLLWANKPSNFEARYNYSFDKFYGFGKNNPIMALGIAFFMISLAGIPPFSMFWGKIFIISVALDRHEIALAFVMIINSAIAVCYYFKPIIAMFFNASLHKQHYEDNATLLIKTVTFLTLILSAGGVFVVSYLFDFIGLFDV